MPTTILSNDISYIKLKNNPIMHKKTKHNEFKYHCIFKKVEDGLIYNLYSK